MSDVTLLTMRMCLNLALQAPQCPMVKGLGEEEELSDQGKKVCQLDSGLDLLILKSLSIPNLPAVT